MKANKKKSLVDIYSGTPWEAEKVKDLLQAADLNASLKDGISGITTATSFLNIGNFAVKVVVSSEDYADAMRVLTTYTGNN